MPRAKSNRKRSKKEAPVEDEAPTKVSKRQLAAELDEFKPFRRRATKKSAERLVPIQELVEQPWCYYCERKFADDAVLLNHMRAKHFKCVTCSRRLTTAGGLSVHMSQVHKLNLTQIPNALPERDSPDIEIFIMQGIPDEVLRNHRNALIKAWDAAAQAHMRRTGNPPPGTKPKPRKRIYETEENIDIRLEKFKRRKLEDQALAKANAPTPKPVDPFGAPANDPFNRTAPAAAAPEAAAAPPAKDVDDLIASVQSENKSVAATAPAKKKKQNPIVMRYVIEDRSPDEMMMQNAKYSVA